MQKPKKYQGRNFPEMNFFRIINWDKILVRVWNDGTRGSAKSIIIGVGTCTNIGYRERG